jgi:hypothetical protein
VGRVWEEGGLRMEIPESVKAAGNWLGGALGRVLEAAVGMPPPLEEETRGRSGSGSSSSCSSLTIPSPVTSRRRSGCSYSSSGHVHGDASPMEIPESVKAAGNWLGGALGRVLEL